MSYPTLRPEWWYERERQQRARDARLGRAGTTADRRHCVGTCRLRFWAAVIFTAWLTYALRKIDVDGLWLLVGILVATPLLVVAVGEWLKCWYERQIDSPSLLEAGTPPTDAAEEARKERLRAEMAQSIMSELRDASPVERPPDNHWMGKTILEGELLGEIVLLPYGAECSDVAYAFPLPAAVERAERVPTGVVIAAGAKHGRV
jgi:hypothetical protein|eukprot:COSAG03_NODE_2863_length_2394_cov_2.307190_3_plen_204_part_00